MGRQLMNRTYLYRLRLHSFHKFASIRVIGGFQFSFLTANYANKRQLCHYDFCSLTAAATWIEERLSRCA